ncbi:hypothetical protein BN946_scf184633.g1 [Trametes cinnabarina]|uniref:BTB domain-containing protein n=1 Tax=Pycnoporus cinnabarinus TaxID=5643 RepID=A0A060SL47_PYCCI|nr:hypothetical protein BN946_scf184633.g1 [Trametes cinnabarina]
MLSTPNTSQDAWLETLSNVQIATDPATTSDMPRNRDVELWFEDGNLVLVAGDTEFKVYRGPLIAHSDVFKDMLSLPQPGEDRQPGHLARDFCPVIPLYDSPDDLRYVLRVFVPGSSLRAGHFEPSFDEISACIRIGHKYQIEDLVKRNTEYLQKFYPADFDAYVAARRHRPKRFKPIHAIGVVNLARLTGTQSLLPAALMECCTLGPEIVQGFKRADGTAEVLSPEDLGRCFIGRARMAQASARIAHQMFRQTVARGCRHPACCIRVLQRLLNELGDARIELVSNLDWCIPWAGYVDEKDEERELCGKCYKMLEEERPRHLQREVWQILPTMMGVSVEQWGEKGKDDA